MDVNTNLSLRPRSSMDQLEPIITNYLPPQPNSTYHLLTNVEIDLANESCFSPSNDVSILDVSIDNRLESFLKGIEDHQSELHELGVLEPEIWVEDPPITSIYEDISPALSPLPMDQNLTFSVSAPHPITPSAPFLNPTSTTLSNPPTVLPPPPFLETSPTPHPEPLSVSTSFLDPPNLAEPIKTSPVSPIKTVQKEKEKKTKKQKKSQENVIDLTDDSESEEGLIVLYSRGVPEFVKTIEKDEKKKTEKKKPGKKLYCGEDGTLYQMKLFTKCKFCHEYRKK